MNQWHVNFAQGDGVNFHGAPFEQLATSNWQLAFTEIPKRS